MSDETELCDDTEHTTEEPVPAPDSGDEMARLTAENEALKARLGELEKQCEDLKKEDKYRLAEFENFRRRTRTEQEEMRKSAAKALLVELLDIEDGFANAIEGSETADLAAWREGVIMIAKKFRGILEKHGVQPIDAQDSEFDPGFHEALFVVDEGEHKGQKVVQVMQR
ncbi:MAG TPA: nucleotide exchange factor GrpE, partial [Spirochaetota bacterium]|nr:nucleotide exchange factor GrpE [Spirochaetota bacterium]